MHDAMRLCIPLTETMRSRWSSSRQCVLYTYTNSPSGFGMVGDGVPAVVARGDEGCDAAEKSSFVVEQRASFGPFRRALVQRVSTSTKVLTVVRRNAVRAFYYRHILSRDPSTVICINL